VVSTALDEVKSNFSDVCQIAGSHEEFIAQCRAAATEPDTARIQRGIELAARNTWESIVENMERHIADALGAREALFSAPTGTDAAGAHPLPVLKHV
jgi:hypothetical protein